MAVSYTWTGAAGNGLGNDPNNWSPVGVPGNSDIAVISNGATIEGPTGFRLVTFNITAPNVDLKDLDSAKINLTSTNLILENAQSVICHDWRRQRGSEQSVAGFDQYDVRYNYCQRHNGQVFDRYDTQRQSGHLGHQWRNSQL